MSKTLIWKIHRQDGTQESAVRNKRMAVHVLSYYDEGTLRYKRRIVYRLAPDEYLRIRDHASPSSRVVARAFQNAVAVEKGESVNLEPIEHAEPEYREEEDEEE